MAAGLRVWDAAENLIIDFSTAMSIALGSVELGDNHPAGSMQVPEFSIGRPYVVVTSAQKFKGDGNVRKAPTATASGTTLSWSAGDACYLAYGTY